jgi:hypothetical protein
MLHPHMNNSFKDFKTLKLNLNAEHLVPIQDPQFYMRACVRARVCVLQDTCCWHLNKGTEFNFYVLYYPLSNVNKTVKIKSETSTLKHITTHTT